MRRRVLTALLVVVAVVTVVLTVRSWTTDDTDRARAAVERFAAAVEDRRYGVICDELLADELLQKLRAVELPCPEALRIGFGDVREPRLTVENVVVVEDRARAAVRSAAADQPTSEDVLSLRRQGGRWRISALANENAGAGATPAVTGPTAPTPVGPLTVGTAPTPPAGGAAPGAPLAGSSAPGSPAPGLPPAGSPAAGALTPSGGRLPHDEPPGARPAPRTAAEARRERRLRALQRRAMREQGRRGE